LQRRKEAGHTTKEAMRALKRRLSDVMVALVAVGLTRSDGHLLSGARPQEGCPEWRSWRPRSPVLVVRSSRSSRPRSWSCAGDADRGSSPLSITEIPQLTAGVGAR